MNDRFTPPEQTRPGETVTDAIQRIIAGLPGPDGQDIDLHGKLPTPEELGESADAPSASHGDFHDRPEGAA